MDQSNGITSEQARTLLLQYGYNEIRQQKKTTPLTIFIAQFNSLLVILLIFASFASFLLGDVLDGVFILLIVILNAILGFVQEYKAEKAISALKKMTTSTVRVIRDDKQQEIDSKLLVPSDVIELTEGDKIPADCRLVESIHLEVNEASLTGESLPVEKNAHQSDRNQLFLGTIIAKGRCKAEVSSTGMSTKFGKIAGTLSEIKEEDTLLQKKLNLLGKQLGIMGFTASLIVFCIGFITAHPFFEMLLTSISLAVAAVPEGLPAVLTITLAVGMQRMAKRRAILRKLSAIESLGGATIIATDKTGTLTRNQMRVVALYYDGKRSYLSDKKILLSNATFLQLLKAAVVCNNATLVYKHDHGTYDVLGDTTEGALLLLASDLSVDYSEVKHSGVLFEEYAFDPQLRLMSVGREEKNKKYMYSKGAPESIIPICSYYLNESGKNPLTDDVIQKLEQEYKLLAQKGLRVLAFSYKEISYKPTSRKQAESNHVFIGFTGIADPVRPEVEKAIQKAEAAGIKTVMITGDNELTANTVASEIGLIRENEEIITGSQFETLDDNQALDRMPAIRIFARTSPDMKYRIVQLLQKQGHIVAVTGDGVNDALALKQADIGVAMGIAGTDVAKEAADMIITDDNYATIVSAVEEGRTIFENIKSAVKYLIGCNIGEVIAVLVALLLGWPLILTPLQLLYINLVTDGLPAIALAVHPKHEGIMKHRPQMGKWIFNTVDFIWLMEVSLITAATTLIAFYLGNIFGNLELARTLAFTTIILVQQFILFNIWIKEDIFLIRKLSKNPIFLIAFLGPLVLQPFLLYIPLLSGIFKITSVSMIQLVFVLLLSSCILFSAQLRKFLLQKVRFNVSKPI